MTTMIPYHAKECQYRVLLASADKAQIFPYIRAPYGPHTFFSVSTEHGRSFVIGKNEDGRWVVSKGNGLCYTEYSFIHTGEFGDDTLGLLLLSDAKRDFLLGQEIEKLGVKTNHMEYVIMLEKELRLMNGHIVKPVLLQYNVECPYRISDAAYMSHDIIEEEIQKWKVNNDNHFDAYYMIAANVLIKNLRILHDNQILHNAIHEQNYTWALELLDFELACSPAHPYDKKDYQRHVKSLFPREIFQTYVIICQIADILHERVNQTEVVDLFKYYNFNIEQYAVNNL